MRGGEGMVLSTLVGSGQAQSPLKICDNFSIIGSRMLSGLVKSATCTKYNCNRALSPFCVEVLSQGKWLDQQDVWLTKLVSQKIPTQEVKGERG